MANDKIACNLQAETNVLSIALTDNDAANLIINALDVDNFSNKKYQYIFECLKDLYRRGVPVEINSLVSTLEEKKYLSLIGGIDFISNLLLEYKGSDGVEENIRILKNKTTIRQLFNQFDDLETKYFLNDFENDNEFLNIADTKLNEIIQNRTIEGFKNLKEVSRTVVENMQAARASGSSIVGVDTGYSQLNKITSGLQKGEVWVLAARPSVGKTALGINIAYKVAQKTNCPVLFFSLEMDAGQIGSRILSSVSNVSSDKIATGLYNKEDGERIAQALKEMSSTPIFIDETPNIDLNDLEAKTYKFHAEHKNLKLILIDYLGLIKTTGRFENERIRIGNICHRIHSLAKKLNVPIILISQLSRAPENGGGGQRRPIMSDLRESGDIEQDADKVVLLYRSDYQSNGATNAFDGDNTQETVNNIPVDRNSSSVVEVIVSKNRTGPTGTAYLLFMKSYSSFKNPAGDVIESYKKQHKL